jgi:hypothetical protein
MVHRLLMPNKMFSKDIFSHDDVVCTDLSGMNSTRERALFLKHETLKRGLLGET